MGQNWISIVKSNWIFFKFYLLIYIYIYIYIDYTRYNLNSTLYIEVFFPHICKLFGPQFDSLGCFL